MASSSSSSSLSLVLSSSMMPFTLPLFLLLLSTTNMMMITMSTAFDLRPQSNNNNYPLLLSTTRIRIRSYPQPPCLLSNNNKGSNIYRSRRRGKQQLYMGGYYAEDLTNDNIDNNYNNEDRSKTHMIFGVRCTEKEKSFLIPTTTTTTTITETARTDTIEVTVTGLQPLLKDDDDDEDDEDNPSVLREDDNNNDDDDFVSILLEQANRSLQKQKQLRVLEIGADPIFSLALSKLISSTISSTTGTNDDDDDGTHSVTIYHPDERRLRVLDHAYQFFNEITSNKCSFQTVPLKDDEPMTIDSDSTNDNAIHVNCCCSWIVFTSAKLVSKRLDAAMTIVAATSIMANNNHRVIVPSSIISNEQLKRYNYHEIAMGSSSNNNNDKIGNDIDSSVVLEILNSK